MRIRLSLRCRAPARDTALQLAKQRYPTSVPVRFRWPGHRPATANLWAGVSWAAEISRTSPRRIAPPWSGGAKRIFYLVRAVGLEPTRRCHRGILSPLRLPVPPRPLWSRDQRLSAFSGEVESGGPKTRPSLTHDPPKCERFGDKILPHFNIFAPCCLRQSLNPVTHACFRQSLGLSVYQGRMF